MRALAALFLVLAAPPTAMADETRYAELARQEARVAAIAHRLTSASAGWCPAVAPQPGWILSDLRRIDARDRAEAAGVYGAPDAPFIAAVAPGSPAERAGLARGTGIAAIDGKAVPVRDDTATIRVDAVIVMLAAIPPAAAWTLTDSAGRVHHIPPSPGCASAFRVELDGVQAAANGQLVRIRLDLAQSVADDQELAAVIAHELAHNILRHRDRLGDDRSARRVRLTEVEADRLSVWLLADAGYDPAAAVRFWNRHKRPLMRAPSHPPRRERIAAIEAETAAMQAARAADPRAAPDWVAAPPPLD
jgi:Zn-dependent protease with chaperone function